jgi:hypothetical protein
MTECRWCEEEQDDTIFVCYNYEEGWYCKECRNKIENGAMDTYYRELAD